MKVVIVGGGYVGVATAAALAGRGHATVLVEREEERRAALKNGTVPFYEPGLSEAFQMERIDCAASLREVAEGTRCVFVCVGTPQGEKGPDLSQLWEVAKELVFLPPDCVIAVKSTVPPGVCGRLERWLRTQGCLCPVAFVPEFLAQGRALEGARRPDRVVLGLRTERGAAVLRELYAGEQIFQMSREEAELTKLCANACLAVRLAFAGELAQCCEAMGADYRKVVAAVGADPRIGREYLDGGAGFGGSCLPKDGAALLWAAGTEGVPLTVLSAALQANERQKGLLLEKLHRYYRSVAGLKIAVLGLAFKPETDDLRGAPAVECAEALLAEGAELTVWDRAAAKKFLRRFPAAQAAQTPAEALDGAQACLIFTAWREIRTLRLEEFAQRMKVPLVLDGRRCFEGTDFADYGVVYETIGRPALTEGKKGL